MNKPQHRIDNPEIIDEAYIEAKLKEGSEVIVQFVAETFTDAMFMQLDGLCSRHDESFGIRFYGQYGNSFDCKVVEKVPSVKSLWVDCLVDADNTDSLGTLLHIRKLSIGIHNLKDSEILRFDNFKKLKELYIGIGGATKASINLEYLKDFKNLSFLIVTGKVNNIEVIGMLDQLEELNLNSISNKTTLGFLNNNKKLKTLRITLGGREDLNEIISSNVENLELVWIRGLNDLSALSNFSKLKTLLIENQAQVKKIDLVGCSKDIEKIQLINCTALSDVSGLDNLLNLKQLSIYKTKIDFDSYINKKFSKTLKIFTLVSGKKGEDRKNAAVLLEKGYPTQAEHFKAADEYLKKSR